MKVKTRVGSTDTFKYFSEYHTFILWTQHLQRNVKFPVCILVFRPFVITWRITLRLLSKIGNINIRTNCKFKL